MSVLKLSEIDVSKITVVNNKFLYNNERFQVLVDEYVPIYFNQKYNKYSIQNSNNNKLIELFKRIDEIVDGINQNKNKHSKLLKNDYTNIKLSENFRAFDYNKNLLCGSDISYSNKECKLVISFSTIGVYVGYICTSIYVNQLQIKDRNIISTYECLF
jgi:hypothetical protein